MARYARIARGAVAELFEAPEGVAIGDCFTAELAGQFVPVTDGVEAMEGWTATEADGAWVFAAPAAREPTRRERAADLLAGGLTIVSVAVPALSGVYPADAVTRGKLLGAHTMNVAAIDPWPVRDSAGQWRAFPPAQFAAFVSAIHAFGAACDLILDGHEDAGFPPATATIP
jgi:hypothetical protein